PTKPPILSKFAAPHGLRLQSSSQPPLTILPTTNPVEAMKSAISNRSPMLSSLIEHALDLKLTETGIEIQFAGQNKFYCEMLQAPENVEVIKELAESVIGMPQQVKIVLVNGPSRQSLSQTEGDDVVRTKNTLLNKIKGDSSVKAFLEVF